MIWLENNQLQIDPPTRPKKITGTRLASILGLNRWSSPFKTWCEITRTYEEPFVETIYTTAGKTIEPIQVEYLKQAYYLTDIKTPEDIYGKDYFKKTWGDFFKESKIFGGMWDALLYKDGEIDTLIEFKTTKRVEDWLEDIPEYYALQAALYAYLLGVDKVMMVVSFLDDSVYVEPSSFQPNTNNTLLIDFTLSERYPHFHDIIRKAEKWHSDYVATGISPEYTDIDKDIIKELQRSTINPTTDLSLLLKEAEELGEELALMKEKEDRLKLLKSLIKDYLLEQFKEGDTSVLAQSDNYEWTVSLSSRTSIDKDKLIQDGLLDRYETTNTTYTLRQKRRDV